MTQIQTYNALDESTLFIGTTGDPPVFVTDIAEIVIRGGNKIDGQTAGGTNKARVKFKGVELTKIIVSFVILPEEEDHFWQDTFTLLKMPGDKARALPLDITNPMINKSGVTTVVVGDYTIEKPDPIKGRTIVINFREWQKETFDPKAEPAKGKARIKPTDGSPSADFANTTLADTVPPRQ